MSLLPAEGRALTEFRTECVKSPPRVKRIRGDTSRRRQNLSPLSLGYVPHNRETLYNLSWTAMTKAVEQTVLRGCFTPLRAYKSAAPIALTAPTAPTAPAKASAPSPSILDLLRYVRSPFVCIVHETTVPLICGSGIEPQPRLIVEMQSYSCCRIVAILWRRLRLRPHRFPHGRILAALSAAPQY